MRFPKFFSSYNVAENVKYGIHRVATCQGKVREKQNFLQVRELSGNFEKMSGNFGHLTNVREMSGNFVMIINFFLNMLGIFLLVYIFKS